MPQFPDPDDRNVLADECRKCSALVESRTRISWGVGSPDATVVVVGEAPGAGTDSSSTAEPSATTAEEPRDGPQTGTIEAARWRGGNYTGMAYTSRHSGRRIRTLFEDLGYAAEELYFTNAVKCFPADPESDRPTNREPTTDERANCRPYLLEELEAVDPACVVPTGKHATATLLEAVDRNLDGFLDSVLEPIRTSELPPILPILHPSYQNIWIARLGYEPEEYRAAIGEALADLGARRHEPS